MFFCGILILVNIFFFIEYFDEQRYCILYIGREGGIVNLRKFRVLYVYIYV